MDTANIRHSDMSSLLFSFMRSSKTPVMNLTGAFNYKIVQPPGLRPPPSVFVMAATLAISSKTSFINSPVTAEHSA